MSTSESTPPGGRGAGSSTDSRGVRHRTAARSAVILGALACGGDAPTAPEGFIPPVSTTAVHLVPGEFATLGGAEVVGGVDIPAAAESRSYLVAVHDARATVGPESSLRFSVIRLDDVTAGVAPRPRGVTARGAALPAENGRRAAASGGRGHPHDPLESWLMGGESRFREQVSRDLRRAGARPADPAAGRRRRDAAPIAPPWRASVRARAVSAVGDTLEFGSPVQADGSLASCSSPVRVAGVVRAVGSRFVVVEDTAVAGVMTAADHAELLAEIEQVVFPVDSAYFGLPADIDGNGAVIAFITGEVNRLGAAGFFTPSDFADAADCPAANQGELLWLIAPDPNAAFGIEPISLSLVRSRLPGIVAHELQHLIHASRRVFEAGGDLTSADVPWLNEGLSHVAEEASGLFDAGRRTGENFGFEDLLQTGVRARFDRYHLNNFRFVRDYLASPGDVPAFVDGPITVGDLRRTRGFGYLFLRWLADQFATGGGDGLVASLEEEALFRALTIGGTGLETSADNVLSSLSGALGIQRGWDELLGLYVATPAVDDVTEPQIPLSPLLRLTTWNLPAVYENAAAGGFEADFGGGFPLSPRLILPGTLPTGTYQEAFGLLPSSAVYFRIEGVRETPLARLQILTAGGQRLTSDSPIQVTIVRTF